MFFSCKSNRARCALPFAIFAFSLLVAGSMIMPGANAAPSVTLNPTSGPPGTVVQIVCSGYTANGQVQATINGTDLGTKTADSHGDLNFNVTVPNFPDGTYKFISTDLTTQTQTQVQFTITSTTTTASPTPKVPEFQSLLIVLTLFIAVSVAAILTVRKRKTNDVTTAH